MDLKRLFLWQLDHFTSCMIYKIRKLVKPNVIFKKSQIFSEDEKAITQRKQIDQDSTEYLTEKAFMARPSSKIGANSLTSLATVVRSPYCNRRIPSGMRPMYFCFETQ